jgi:hypothetical protein
MNIYLFTILAFEIDYVEEMFRTVVESIGTAKIKDAINELESLTPPPMNTMLNKQPRVEAIARKRKRDSMELGNVPPTNPGNPQ